MTEHQKDFSQLNDCLVDGDERSVATGRRTRWRAMGTSMMLQTIIGTALVLIPLLATGTLPTRKLSPDIVWTSGPRGENRPAPVKPDQQHPRTHRIFPTHGIVAPKAIPPHVSQIDDREPSSDPVESANACPGCIPNATIGAIPFNNPILGTRREPDAPVQHTNKRIKVSTMEPGALIHRVEPRYPVIPLQLRKEGVVELRAIIGTDGTIHSLEVLSGSPLFIEATLNAVRQWRYRPTLLNGEAVEVETRITVTYTLGK